MEEVHSGAGTISFSGVGSPSSELASSRRRAGAQKRKAGSLGPSNSFTTPSKRINRARQVPSNLAATASDFQAGGMAVPASSVKAEMTTSLGFPRAEAVLSPTVAEKLNKESQLEALKASFEAEFEAIILRGANAHVVPNHCGEFRSASSHTFTFNCFKRKRKIGEESVSSNFDSVHHMMSDFLFAFNYESLALMLYFGNATFSV